MGIILGVTSSGGSDTYGLGRDVDAHEGSPLGLYTQYLGHTDRWHSDRYGDFPGSQRERRAAERRRDAAHLAFPADAVQHLFADCETAGAERRQHQYGIDDQECAPAARR